MTNRVRSRWLKLPRFLVAASLVALLATCQHDGPTSGERSTPGSPSLDVTSSSTMIFVGAGDIGTCTTNNDEATAQLLDGIAGTVFAVGDNAYGSGTAAEYACYNATWGRHKARTRPVPGDRDYKTAGATGYFGYFGAAAGDPSKGYYSYDLGEWHIIALNSKVPMNVGSAQEQWLRADLAASAKQCILAYWHHARFYSNGANVRASVKPLWDALYLAGADVVINSDERFYERFAPQTPDGVADPANGIREFIVGTGGGSINAFGTILPTSEVRSSGTYGVLKLSLHPGSYGWQFVPVAGKTFTDAGTTACHGDLPPAAAPGGPYTSEDVVAFDGSGSTDPQGDLPLTYAWDFGDGATGAGVAPTHTYTADGVYTVTLVVTDAVGRTSDPATTTATIANFAPTVNVGPDWAVAPGESYEVRATFSDPGAADAPWTYVIEWGDGTSDNGSTSNQTAPITATHTYATVGLRTVRVTVTDKDGGAGADDLALTVTNTRFFTGAGDISNCTDDGDAATAALLDRIPGTVYTLGDNAYPDGTIDEFNNCYHPTWGRHKARTRPATGNHEYQTLDAAGYFAYFGAAAGDPSKGYYSFDLGAWHIIALNSSISMAAGSAQDQWLQADLAGSTRRCTIAYWHHPRFTSGGEHSNDPTSDPAWWALYRAGAEIVIVGHSHFYERYAPQTPAATADPAFGIRQFVVGTGGDSHDGPGSPTANVEAQNGSTFGVLKLSLDDGGYSWEFIPEAGETFTDAGSGVCHDAPANQPPTANPAGPYSADADVTFNGNGSTDFEGDTPFTYAWNFGDGSTGTGVAPTHTYQVDGIYTVTLTVTDSKGAVSAPATTTATIANVAPTVNAGGDVTIPSGSTFRLQATFSDPGSNDAPWAYTISWGDGSPPEAGTVSIQSPIIASHVYADGGPYTVRVTVTDKDGGADTDELTVTIGSAATFETLVGAGDIGTCANNNDEATATLLDGIAGTVFTLGDNAYASGTAAEYACYNATWGRHNTRTRPVPGDRDYKTAGAAGYFDYFGGAAGDRDKGYYSYDLGAWHIIALNSRIAMNVGSAQEQWLRADLAANPRQCTLAYWHNARFFSNGANIRSGVKPLWDALYQAGAEIVLNADERFYERFAPQTPDGVVDPANGIREFIVGTGGGSINGFGTILPNSEVRNSGTYGVLKLTLAAGSYSWAFVPVAGQTFTDTGNHSCH